MSHQRIVPTNRDGVEDRFPGRLNPNDAYDRNRCRICGVPWENPKDVNTGLPMTGQDHATLSPGCAGKRSSPTLFDVVEETKHKGAYS